ncbi:MAG: DNA polymerase III subunit gamma/tau, partial [Pseudomonadota bacterium]|nr:DNA polymerase III subunit gamma/tau [Pseudomonadota bacterium]
IIDEVHQLSNHSFNALLKTLEEPPAHLKFVFATTEIRKVPVTVLSRCQRFDLRRVEAGTLAEHLRGIVGAEGSDADDEALALIARAAEGSVRDALSILDQAISHAAGKVEAAGVRAMLGLADKARIIDLFEHVMRGDVSAALGELREQYELGADPSVVMTDLADFVHYVTRLKYVPEAAEDAALTEAERKRGAAFARDLSVRVLGRAWQILVKGIAEIEASERPLPAADMVLVRLTHAANLPAPDEVLRSLGEGASAAPSGTPQGNARPSGNGVDGGSAAGKGPATIASDHAAPAPGVPGSATAAARSGTSRPPGTAVQAARQPQARPEAPEAAEPLRLESFEDLIVLAEDRRDILMRTCLRRHVRLIGFADGRLEFAVAGNPPPNFVQDLSAKLQAWTGRRWMVATSREGGAPTVEETDRAEADERNEMARANPAVDAIMSRFPGARIIDVKLRQPEPDLANPDLDAQGEPVPGVAGDDGLDDFFD